jgi:hypothetical protein
MILTFFSLFSEGWRYGYRFMDSGLGHGQSTISFLELNVMVIFCCWKFHGNFCSCMNKLL